MADILVIDDEPSVRSLVTDILDYAGFRTRETANGYQGLEWILEQQFDLVVCDVDMPAITGYQLLREVRSNPAIQTTPFIFLTGKDERQHMRYGMELGADDYLTKPFEPAELLAAVNTQLKKQSALNHKVDATLQQAHSNIIYALPHELRTPLLGITGYAELMNLDAESLSPADVRDYAQGILRSSHRLQRHIENVLVYAQVEILRHDTEQLAQLRQQVVHNPEATITDVALEIASKYLRPDDLHLEIHNTPLAVTQNDLERMLREIIDNAFKFSEAGSSVYVTLVGEDNIATLSVSDAGRGMQREQLEHIAAFIQFDRVFHEQQGLGLGLTIAKQLASLYGGELHLFSRPNEGTVVRLDLRQAG